MLDNIEGLELLATLGLLELGQEGNQDVMPDFFVPVVVPLKAGSFEPPNQPSLADRWFIVEQQTINPKLIVTKQRKFILHLLRP
jgi:hypothetical protein